MSRLMLWTTLGLLMLLALAGCTGGTPKVIYVTATPAPKPSATVTVPATNTPAPTQTERVVVITATSAPTNTPVPPTAPPVVVVVTATPPPVPPTAVPPANPPANPPSNPPSTGIRFGAPSLSSPADGSGYTCFRPLILSWSGANLGPNDYYLIESTKKDHPNEWGAMTDWTKDTTVTLNPEKGGGGCSAPWWGGLGVYIWRVRIITGDKSTHSIWGNASPPSAPFTITYG